MDTWRKSSYSGPGDGNECVEIANSPTHIAIRDSKAPSRATLTFPARAFSTFVQALKREDRSTGTGLAGLDD
ncbi:DUF397 domain-containing protein [Streptomyces hirsutus]|uniref:DUF397 domain-containing protein n=1 Tax=Streptomyces hirsutus TaxID=35620 RepID=UPI0006E1C43B|nr:DUF397 domain-containing protein [Streptomyces hirsutus]